MSTCVDVSVLDYRASKKTIRKEKGDIFAITFTHTLNDVAQDLSGIVDAKFYLEDDVLHGYLSPATGITVIGASDNILQVVLNLGVTEAVGQYDYKLVVSYEANNIRTIVKGKLIVYEHND